jgi:hypothetical protein
MARRARHQRRPPLAERLLAKPVEAAKAASLRYVSDQDSGIRRRPAGIDFQYIDPAGRIARDAG